MNTTKYTHTMTFNIVSNKSTEQSFVSFFFQLCWDVAEQPTKIVPTSNRRPHHRLPDSAPSKSANAAQTFVRFVYDVIRG